MPIACVRNRIIRCIQGTLQGRRSRPAGFDQRQYKGKHGCITRLEDNVLQRFTTTVPNVRGNTGEMGRPASVTCAASSGGFGTLSNRCWFSPASRAR